MKTRLLALAAAAATAALLSGCLSATSSQPENPPAQATVEPPPQPQPQPQVVDEATAQKNQDAAVSQGPYLYELLEDKATRKVWTRMTNRKGTPAWIRKGEGPTEPTQLVEISGKPYQQATLCQQHNCPNTFFFLIGESKAYGLHADFSNPRKTRPVFYGAPPAAEKAVLQQAYEQEKERQQR